MSRQHTILRPTSHSKKCLVCKNGIELYDHTIILNAIFFSMFNIEMTAVHNGTNGGNNRMLNFCMAIKGIKSSFRKPNQNGCQSFNSA